MANKSGIHIKPSRKGKFTRWAKSHGFKSVQAAASAVLKSKDKYSLTVVKEANFAHNAKTKFSHAKGKRSKSGRRMID